MTFYHVSENLITIGSTLSTAFIPKNTPELARVIAAAYGHNDVILSAAKTNEQKFLLKQINQIEYLSFLKGQAEGIIEAVNVKQFNGVYHRIDSIFLTDNLQNAQQFGTKHRKQGFHIYEVELIDETKIQEFDYDLYEDIKKDCDLICKQTTLSINSHVAKIESKVKTYLSHVGNKTFIEYLTPDNNAVVKSIIF